MGWRGRFGRGWEGAWGGNRCVPLAFHKITNTSTPNHPYKLLLLSRIVAKNTINFLKNLPRTTFYQIGAANII